MRMKSRGKKLYEDEAWGVAPEPRTAEVMCARTLGTFPDMLQQETPSRSQALVGVTKPSLSRELEDVSESARTLLCVEAFASV